MKNDLISRQAVKEWLEKWGGYIDADIIARMQYRVADIPSAQRSTMGQLSGAAQSTKTDTISRQDFDKCLEDAEKESVKNRKYVLASALNTIRGNLRNFPSAQPEGWMEQNRDRILKAGMEGREVEFRIGGRLFAIREKAQ